jgi:hypothetical protein
MSAVPIPAECGAAARLRYVLADSLVLARRTSRTSARSRRSSST